MANFAIPPVIDFTVPEELPRRTGLLIDLDWNQCRWPVKEIGHATYLFCCEDQYPGKSYCIDHCTASYGPGWQQR